MEWSIAAYIGMCWDEVQIQSTQDWVERFLRVDISRRFMLLSIPRMSTRRRRTRFGSTSTGGVRWTAWVGGIATLQHFGIDCEQHTPGVGRQHGDVD